MMEVIESGDEYIEPRFSNGSMSCLFPALIHIDSPRRSLSYDKLPEEPLKLTIRKLDGSSFGIKVSKMGTVRELKRAVEAAFSYLPKKGPRRVSWEHVWGQFCLCHEGHKLSSDSDYIRTFRIKDGDQLQFVHHASNTYNLVRARDDDSDSDDEPSTSYGDRDEKQDREVDDGDQRIEILVDNQDNIAESDDGVISRCEYRFSHILRRWFQYNRLPSSHIRFEERGNCSSSSDILRFFKNIFGVSSSNKYDSRRRAWKVK